MIPSEKDIRGILSGPIDKTGHHLICTCHNCGKELHYYYNLITGLSDCKKCSRGFNLFQFLRGWNALYLLEGAPVDISEVKPLKLLGSTTNKEEPKMLPAKLPPGFTVLKFDDDNEYAAYLRMRKYTKEDFELYQPGYTDLIQRYEGCVIIPIYRNWVVSSFVARNINEKVYRNQPNAPFHLLLDGLDECTMNTKVGILTEGHFDRISVSTELALHEQEFFKSVASFGKKLTKEQIQLICATNIEDLYFFYDMSDAIKQIKVFGNAIKRRVRVWGCWQPTQKDAGDMTKAEILQMLATAQPIENYTINIVQSNALK